MQKLALAVARIADMPPAEAISLPKPARQLFGSDVELLELTPEAGARRYFRPTETMVAPGLDAEQALVKKWLLVTSPDVAPLATTQLLQQREVRTPRLGPTCKGAYLVEDLGDLHLKDDPSLPRYNQLLDAWHAFAFDPLPKKHPNAALALDQELFHRELNMFLQRYLQAYRQRCLDDSAAINISEASAELAKLAASGPTCLQHRDFHSRNFLLPDDNSPAWIDHQDMRRGPLYYDLASLYTDAYIDLSDQVFSRLRGEIGPLGACFSLGAEEAQERFHWCALQRVLKALGTFGNLLVAGREEYEDAEQRARGMALALLDMSGDFPAIREAIA